MTINEIANRLVELCRKGDFETAQKELYAQDVISIEPYETPNFEKETKGLPAILEKGKKFEGMVDTMHKLEVSEPLIGTSAFACTMRMDMTMKDKQRYDMTEVCAYVVKDGKIVSEQFFI
ncbi:nuclear transport factor 2 family protein [Longitalea luteola]|uniref:nuclear transport factor 2 family protein n=1 Tax=Longitalea luteola TaxID=2812563 RepID=UPI001A96279D|nr:nuclear transport factor 2 family protein [Longitalea luteola]